MADSAPIESIESASDQPGDYRPLDGWAILSLVLGLLSAAALAAPVLWLVPILGMLAAAVALARLRRESGRSGRAVALTALGLSAFFLALAAGRIASAQWIVIQQARPVADRFFEYLRQGKPEKAVLLNWTPGFRHPIDEDKSLLLRSNEEARAEYRKFLSEPLIRMLLALGERAEVRYYRTARVGIAGNAAQVEYWYTITFTDDDGRKKTYFCSIILERKPPGDPQLNPWRILDFAGGFNPTI